MGGNFTVSFPAQFDDDRLLSWMMETPKDEICILTEGKIVFYEEGLDESTLFEYKFNDAALINWKESFTTSGTSPLTVTLTISAAIHEIKNVNYVKTWQKSWVAPSTPTSPQSMEEENVKPKLIEFYLTNEEGRRIQEYCVGDTVILNILTENRIGHKCRINLNDATHDFEYQGQALQNDTIEGLVISKDLEKLPLKVLKQRTPN